MPYISPEGRDKYHSLVFRIRLTEIDQAGDLNYLITIMVDHYLDHYGLNYASLNRVIGVLECAKLELYRRIAAPYEDSKISTNGDVFTINTGENNK